MVVREFHEALARSPETAVAVAAIKVTLHVCHNVAICTHHVCSSNVCSKQALTSVVERSGATTMMGLEKELKEAAHSLERQGASLEVKDGATRLRSRIRQSQHNGTPVQVQ